jgi:hypothetical protein
MHHVAEHVRDAAVPEQDPNSLRDLLGPLDHEFDDVVEVAIGKEDVSGVEVRASRALAKLLLAGLMDALTYLLPVGSLLGLMSSFLNAAK